MSRGPLPKDAQLEEFWRILNQAWEVPDTASECGLLALEDGKVQVDDLPAQDDGYDAGCDADMSGEGEEAEAGDQEAGDQEASDEEGEGVSDEEGEEGGVGTEEKEMDGEACCEHVGFHGGENDGDYGNKRCCAQQDAQPTTPRAALKPCGVEEITISSSPDPEPLMDKKQAELSIPGLIKLETGARAALAGCTDPSQREHLKTVLCRANCLRPGGTIWLCQTVKGATC